MGKLINRIPGSRHLISNLPGSALRTHVESLGKPRDFNKRPQKRQQAFSEPCLVNLISKDTHLVFSIYFAGKLRWLRQEVAKKDARKTDSRCFALAGQCPCPHVTRK